MNMSAEADGDVLTRGDRLEIEIRKERLKKRLAEFPDMRGRLAYLRNQRKMQQNAIEAAKRKIAAAEELINFIERLYEEELEKEEQERRGGQRRNE